MFIYLSTYLSIYLFIYLLIYLFTYLSTCLPIYLSSYLPTYQLIQPKKSQTKEKKLGSSTKLIYKVPNIIGENFDSIFKDSGPTSAQRRYIRIRCDVMR